MCRSHVPKREGSDVNGARQKRPESRGSRPPPRHSAYMGPTDAAGTVGSFGVGGARRAPMAQHRGSCVKNAAVRTVSRRSIATSASCTSDCRRGRSGTGRSRRAPSSRLDCRWRPRKRRLQQSRASCGGRCGGSGSSRGGCSSREHQSIIRLPDARRRGQCETSAADALAACRRQCLRRLRALDFGVTGAAMGL